MHPFDYIRAHDPGDTFALLYSGMRSQGSGEQSWLAWAPQAEVKGGTFSDLIRHCERSTASEESKRDFSSACGLTRNDQSTQWFGYAGYEMLHALEDVPETAPSFIDLPRQWWFRPRQTLSFPNCHPGFGCAEHRGPDPGAAKLAGMTTIPSVTVLHSNLTTARYLEMVRETVAAIHRGAFYQANITRKFYGRFERPPDRFALFQRLCALSPSPYSAYLQFGDTAILSSSPEGFLQMRDDGRVTARPIKGSGAPGDAALLQSLKDRAENLMIVDLMRNDLSRSCDDVRVDSLHEAHDFATIRQLISTVSGQRRGDCTALDVLSGCFPPGSMTGAPKVAAMRWIAAQEQMQRGIYSGALGWIDSATQTADLSVVIRTLIIQGDRFEFQVGGGIVADSVPEKELDETLLKARAICVALGVEVEALRTL